MWNKNKICIVCEKFNPRSMHKTCGVQCDLERKKNSQKQYKAPKQISDKKKLRLKETGWESKTFEEVDKIDNICWVRNIPIPEPIAISYPHLLAKSSHPALRNFTANIWRAYWIEEHNLIDKAINLIKKDLEVLNHLKTLITSNKRNEVKKLVKTYLKKL